MSYDNDILTLGHIGRVQSFRNYVTWNLHSPFSFCARSEKVMGKRRWAGVVVLKLLLILSTWVSLNEPCSSTLDAWAVWYLAFVNYIFTLNQQMSSLPWIFLSKRNKTLLMKFSLYPSPILFFPHLSFPRGSFYHKFGVHISCMVKPYD